MNKKTLKNFLRRETFTICSCLIIIIASSALISSALFTFNKADDKNQVVKSGTFSITFQGNSAVVGDTYILNDSDGLNTDGYQFTVKNTGSIESTYNIMLGRNRSQTTNLIDLQYIRYSIDGDTPKTLTDSQRITFATDEDNTTNCMYLLKSVNEKSGITNTHNVKVWISSSAPDSVISKNLDLSIMVTAVAADPSNEQGYQFAYTGSEEVYTVPYDGTYTIEAAGAEGTLGSKCEGLKTGKGAKISADFDLTAGDKLHIIVGGQGSVDTASNASDGVSGAGGGGSFILKEIPYNSKLSDSNYKEDIAKHQFNITSNTNYSLESLLVAAGGGGTSDCARTQNSRVNGPDGNATSYFNSIDTSLERSKAYSANKLTSNTTSSSNFLSVLAYGSYISSNKTIYFRGYYKYNNSVCIGGFGGGGCADDSRSYGGGWNFATDTNSSSHYTAGSWALYNNATGVNGYQSGNGYVTIKLKK